MAGDMRQLALFAVCKICGEVKDPSEFYGSSRDPSKPASYCKACAKAGRTEYYRYKAAQSKRMKDRVGVMA
jgi:hypothetical protein